MIMHAALDKIPASAYETVSYLHSAENLLGIKPV